MTTPRPTYDTEIDAIADAYWSNPIAGKAELRAAINKAYWLGHLAGTIYGDERCKRQSIPLTCYECGRNPADYPSRRCVGCDAHAEHTNVY